MPYLPQPPSSLTGPLGEYLQVLWRAFNKIPNVSAFSGTTPNSTVSGYPGDIAVNIGSASTTSRVWIKGGDARQPSTTGWAAMRVLE